MRDIFAKIIGVIKVHRRTLYLIKEIEHKEPRKIGSKLSCITANDSLINGTLKSINLINAIGLDGQRADGAFQIVWDNDVIQDDLVGKELF